MITDSADQTALDSGLIVSRDFVWINARVRDTGASVGHGFWSDDLDVAAQVLNPRTGEVEVRSFEASGNLVAVSPIVHVSNLTIQSVNISFGQIGNFNELIRTYDLKHAEIEVYRGLFSANGLVQVSPAKCAFLGFVDRAPITTPVAGGIGEITLECVSSLRELTRTNPATRSNKQMLARWLGDTFRRHVATVMNWKIDWGA